MALSWKKKILDNGVEQFVHVDEDLGTELMMLPTDMALLGDKSFAPWVKRCAEDKEYFFKDFAAVFSKLLELGIQRDSSGRITNTDNVNGGYHSAPKKNSRPQAPRRSNEESDPLAHENEQFRARL